SGSKLASRAIVVVRPSSVDASAVPRSMSPSLSSPCSLANTIAKQAPRPAVPPGMHWAGCGRPLLPFEYEGRRRDILVEGISGVRESALRVGAVVKLHGDVEHHEIRGGHTSARPGLKQSARRGVRPGRSCCELSCQCSGGRCELMLGHYMRRYPNLTGFASGNRLAKHGESRCPTTTGALRNPLQGSGDREHCSRDFYATEG